MEDQRQMKAAALLDYTEGKQKVAGLRGRIAQIGEGLIAAGGDLKKDPSQYAFKRYTLMPQSEIDALVSELAALEEQTENLRRKAVEYGNSI